MSTQTTRRAPPEALDGALVLTQDDIDELGLEAAPDDIGPSWLEIRRAAQAKEVGHG